MDQPGILIKILLNPKARVDERDDAAIDLAAFDRPEVEEALLKVALDSTANDVIRGSCGESLAEIWLRRNRFNSMAYAQLSGAARSEATALINKVKSEWIANQS